MTENQFYAVVLAIGAYGLIDVAPWTSLVALISHAIFAFLAFLEFRR